MMGGVAVLAIWMLALVGASCGGAERDPWLAALRKERLATMVLPGRKTRSQFGDQGAHIARKADHGSHPPGVRLPRSSRRHRQPQPCDQGGNRERVARESRAHRSGRPVLRIEEAVSRSRNADDREVHERRRRQGLHPARSGSMPPRVMRPMSARDDERTRVEHPPGSAGRRDRAHGDGERPQVTARLLSPEGLLVAVCYSPAFHGDSAV